MPGVADAVEHHVVALLGQEHATSRQIHPEPATDQQKQGGALLTGDPLRALVTGGMDGPSDLNIIAVAGIIDWLEVPQQPSAVNGGIHSGVAYVDLALP